MKISNFKLKIPLQPYLQTELFHHPKSNKSKSLRLSKKAIWSGFLALGFVVLSIFIAKHLTLVPAKGGTVIEGLVGQPRYINPLFSDSNPVDKLLATLIFRGLIKFDQEQNAKGDLAKDWRISADGKTYTVNLLKNQKWHDGAKITADDVVFTYSLTQKDNYNGPEKLSFHNVKIEKAGEYQVIFTLSEPFSPFLESLTLGILPKHKLTEQIADLAINNLFNLRPTGAGIFSFEALDYQNNQIKTLTLKVRQGFIKELKFVFYANQSQLMTAYSLGEIDSLALENKDSLSQNMGKSSTLFEQTINSHQYGLFFNLSKDPFKDGDLRKALSLAMPSLANFGDEALGPLPKKSWAADQGEKQISPDLEKAKSKFLDLKSKPVTLTITLPSNEPLEQVAQKIKENWEQLGLKVQLKIISGGEIINQVIPKRDFDLLIFGQEFAPDPDIYVFWHSTQSQPPGLNISGFANRRADKALEEARKTQTVQTRKTDYKNVQTYINEEAPAIFLYQPKLNYLINKKVKGVKIENIWSPDDRFNGFEKWFIRRALRWI